METKEKPESVVARESQHTQLPFELCEPNCPDGPHSYGIRQAISDDPDGGFIIADVNSDVGSPEQSREFAEFIVRACNAHAQIVSALRECKAELISFHGTILDNDVVAPRLSKLIDKAEQALRLAQGEK